jgi:NTP pyrophosphatase (non-canonical NTP hydrolase)
MLKALQNAIWGMGIRFFGEANMTDTTIRGLRMVEEAIEVGHALRLDRQKLHEIVDMVYEKEAGDLYFELGDLLITISALASNRKFDIDQLIEFNVLRWLNKNPKEMAERNRIKEERGLK